MPKTGGILTIEGLDLSVPGEYISERHTPNTLNMTVERGVLRKRIGTTLLGGQIAGTAKEIMAVRQFTRQGTNYVVRVGLEKIEEYDDVGETWDDITGTDLTGLTTNPVDTATPLLSGKYILALTNGVDNIRKYTGTGNTADLGGSPPKARYMVEYNGYLVLGYVDDGTPRPMRVQWSDTGDPETWSGGNSGAKDLIEDGEIITAVKLFGSYVAVHKQSEIYLGYLVGTTSVFKFDRKHTGAGTISSATIQNLPTGIQAFVAHDGIRLFNGISAQLVPSKVNDEIREGINYEYAHKCWSNVIKEKSEYIVGVPIGSQTTGDTVYVYNYNLGTCHKDSRSGITASHYFSTVSQPTWADMSGSWDSQTGRWDDSSLTVDFPAVMLADNSGYTYYRDGNTKDDNTVAVDAIWDSKDFEADDKGMLGRWLEMQLWAKGDSVDVFYSKDRGESWTLIKTVTLTSTYPTDASPIYLYFDFVSSKCRIRFRNNTSESNFYLKQFILGYKNVGFRR